MKPQTLDLHGKNQEETENIFIDFLNQARLKKRTIEVLFITGVGVLQRKLQKMAQENDLEFIIPLSNPGQITIYFE
jgi:DNA-nicking Smr family endonuclease